VFRKKNFQFDMGMTAADIPGWDSLRHTILIMEINRVAGIDLSPEETAELKNLGALYDAIVTALPAA